MSPAPTEPSASQPIDRIVQLYGDLVFDLCESVLWSPTMAQIAFRTVLKALKRRLRSNPYSRYERVWVLKVACDILAGYAHRYGRRLTPSEQIMLDASLNLQARLKQFDSYFHRLTTDEQILLLLRDKYGLPYSEIAGATGIPEGSLKVKRQQALRTLEEWLWDSA